MYCWHIPKSIKCIVLTSSPFPYNIFSSRKSQWITPILCNVLNRSSNPLLIVHASDKEYDGWSLLKSTPTFGPNRSSRRTGFPLSSVSPNILGKPFSFAFCNFLYTLASRWRVSSSCSQIFATALTLLSFSALNTFPKRPLPILFRMYHASPLMYTRRPSFRLIVNIALKIDLLSSNSKLSKFNYFNMRL